MKSVNNPIFNAAEFSVSLSKARCSELSDQLEPIRRAHTARLSKGCAPTDFPYLQQLITAIDAAQSVVEKK